MSFYLLNHSCPALFDSVSKLAIGVLTDVPLLVLELSTLNALMAYEGVAESKNFRASRANFKAFDICKVSPLYDLCLGIQTYVFGSVALDLMGSYIVVCSPSMGIRRCPCEQRRLQEGGYAVDFASVSKEAVAHATTRLAEQTHEDQTNSVMLDVSF